MPRSRKPRPRRRPTRASACSARSTSDGPCAPGSAAPPRARTSPTRSPNCGLSIHTLSAPGTWPSPNSPGRAGRARTRPGRPRRAASRAVNGRGLALSRGSARVLADDGLERRRLGRQAGHQPLDELLASRACSAGLKRRSKPMVEAVFDDIARPQSEPAPWPGRPRRCRAAAGARPQAVVHAARGLRAADVGTADVADEERVAGQHEPGLVAAPRSVTSRQRLSGVWPGVWSDLEADVADAQLLAVGHGVVLEHGRAARWSRIARAGQRGQRRSPEMWSAWVWVSRMWVI